MRVIAISDTHNCHSELVLPDGDVLVHSGDATNLGKIHEVAAFAQWMGKQPFAHKIFVAGNHDFLFERHGPLARGVIESAGIIYLQDQEKVIDGVKFYGSPWQPRFYDWAFNLDRGPLLAKVWDRIPEDTDVLITHGPPAGILDVAFNDDPRGGVGCEDLLNRVNVVKPKFHIFGHIHYSYGVKVIGDTTFINAASCGEGNNIANAPVVFELTAGVGSS